MGSVTQALAGGALANIVPRTPAAGQESVAIAEDFARLALRCSTQACVSGSISISSPSTSSSTTSSGAGSGPSRPSWAADILHGLKALSARLSGLGTTGMSWDQMEELLLMPLAPSSNTDASCRRWVRQDFKARRKLFLEEVAKMAVDGPIHKIEVRRSRCFKDSVMTFSGKVGWVLKDAIGHEGQR